MELERGYIIMITLSDDYGLTLTMTVAKYNKYSFPFTGCDSFRKSSSLAKAVKAAKLGASEPSASAAASFWWTLTSTFASEVWTFRRSKSQVASLPYTVHAMDDFLDPPPGLSGLMFVLACHGERSVFDKLKGCITRPWMFINIASTYSSFYPPTLILTLIDDPSWRTKAISRLIQRADYELP